MFDLGWGEMLVIGILALIVLGPQDLLTTFRATGRWVGRMQKMAREFTRAMNEAADQAGVSEINKSLKAASDPAKYGLDSLKDAADLGPETKKLAEKRAQDAKDWAEKARAAREKRAAEVAASAAEMEAETQAGPDAPSDTDRPAATPDDAEGTPAGRHEAKT